MTRYSNLPCLLKSAAAGSLLAGLLVTPCHSALTSYTNVGDIAFVGSSVNAENSNVSLNENINSLVPFLQSLQRRPKALHPKSKFLAVDNSENSHFLRLLAPLMKFWGFYGWKPDFSCDAEDQIEEETVPLSE